MDVFALYNDLNIFFQLALCRRRSGARRRDQPGVEEQEDLPHPGLGECHRLHQLPRSSRQHPGPAQPDTGHCHVLG